MHGAVVRPEHRYDGLDRLVASDDALGPLVRAEYDARGNRVVEIDANGNRTEIDHDALDRLVERRLPGGLEGDGSAAPRVGRFSWDVAGNQTSAT